MTATATAAAEMPRIAPLRPRPDQRERWMDHSRPLGFEEAAQLVMEAREDDGDRQDVVAHDLRTWAFGSTDGVTTADRREPVDSVERACARSLCFQLDSTPHDTIPRPRTNAKTLVVSPIRT